MSKAEVSSFIANRWRSDEKMALMHDVDDEWLQSDIQKTYSVEFKSDFDQVAVNRSKARISADVC
jgi:hypothetical protein